MLILALASLLTGWLIGIGGLIFSVLGIVGFIEGIVYLCTNDRDFYTKYVIHRQEWF